MNECREILWVYRIGYFNQGHTMLATQLPFALVVSLSCFQYATLSCVGGAKQCVVLCTVILEPDAQLLAESVDFHDIPTVVCQPFRLDLGEGVSGQLLEDIATNPLTVEL